MATTDKIIREHEIVDRGIGLSRRSITLTEHEDESLCLMAEDAASVAIVQMHDDEVKRLSAALNGKAAHEQYLEALRLVDVAGEHREKMFREVDDPDVKRQRGNASSVSHCEGVALGMAACLRALGFADYADRIEHAADNGTDSVSREPA